jgi:hypothetical protein
MRGRPSMAPAADAGLDASPDASANALARSSDLQSGAIRPRLRSRYERWSEPEPQPGPEAIVSADAARTSSPHRDAGLPSEEQVEPLATDRGIRDRTVGFTNKQWDGARTADASARRTIDVRRKAPQPLLETPGPVETPAAARNAPPQPDSDGEARAGHPRISEAERQPPPRSAAPLRANQVQPLQPPSGSETELPPQAAEPGSRPALLSASRARPRKREVGDSSAANGKAAPAAAMILSPQSSRAPEPTSPRPVVERSIAARIQVNIGRVEVRAMYAPPPPARKPSAVPSLSLDEYLKQRDRSG